MDKFERNVLNRCLDKYEKSKLSKEGTKVTRKITLNTKDKTLSSYVGFDSYKYVDDNDAVLLKLEKLGYITTEYSGDTFKSLTLNLNKVDEIYSYLKRDKPSDELEKIINVLNKYEFDIIMKDFIDYVRNYINTKYEYPKSYFEDSVQLDTLLYIIKSMTLIDSEIKKREFSARFLGDSKVFESLESKVIKILKNFDSKENMTNEEILASYNIVKNPSYVLVKNNLIFRLNKSIINLNDLMFEISLSDDMIKRIDILDSEVSKVITVENLTTFYSLEEKDAVIIYLGGFHNHTKQQFLMKIYDKFPNALYYHFGDIDVGGFLIYDNLINKTSIPFIPYKMSISELVDKKVNLKALTEFDRKRLYRLKENDNFKIFEDVIDYMLDNNVKLEQENIY